MLHSLIDVLLVGRSVDDFFRILNRVQARYFGKPLMLHFPVDAGKRTDLLRGQQNLTDLCLSYVAPIEGQVLLDIGCGNGTQGLYVLDAFAPRRVVGVDLNGDNIDIALAEVLRRGTDRAVFYQGDAQHLTDVDDNSIDVVLNVESAACYPDKERFLVEVHRVLKPGGKFVIADRLSRGGRQRSWEQRMDLYHWTYSQYRDAFAASSLTLEAEEDITDRCVKALHGYRSWFRSSAGGTSRLWKYAARLMMETYGRFEIRMFATKRSYHIFSGMKPGSGGS